jgi:hypothetical protein
MLCSAVNIQLIVTVEPLPTKATQRMAFESTLINSSGIVVSLLHMPL